MTATELSNHLNLMLEAGKIDSTTNVVYGTQSQALDVDTIRIVDVSLRDENGKTKQTIRRVLLT